MINCDVDNRPLGKILASFFYIFRTDKRDGHRNTAALLHCVVQQKCYNSYNIMLEL